MFRESVCRPLKRASDLVETCTQGSASLHPGLNSAARFARSLTVAFMTCSLSLNDLQSVEPQKVAITLNRPPARIGMMIEHRQLDLLHRYLVRRRRAGVIDDPVLRAVWRDVWPAQKKSIGDKEIFEPRI